MAKLKRIFIGSSGQAKSLAKALASYLQLEYREAADIRFWNDPTQFPPSQTTLESLIRQAKACDFAVMLLTADDVVKKKGRTLDIPRDNTIFELGLFVAELGMSRSFMVCSADEDALPSDLKGYSYVKVDPVPNFLDAKACDTCIRSGVGLQIKKLIDNAECFRHPTLPLLTKEELAEREKPADKDGRGGDLVLLRSRAGVVVNSLQPVEWADSEFCACVLENLKSGVKYEYYYGDFDDSIGPTAELVQKIATANLGPQVSKGSISRVKENLKFLQRSLSIHFRKRPPLRFCVHNANLEERATCYLRCHGEHDGKFVEWAKKAEAKYIAEELSSSCKAVTSEAQEAAIFHSTRDVELDTSRVIREVMQAFGDGVAKSLYDDLYEACLGPKQK